MKVVEVLQTLEYRGGQLNAALVLEVENFTNWKKRFMCHIIGIEHQFENIISNGPYIPMAAGQRKPEGQWTADERKLEINIGFISGLPKKWLNFCQSLRNINHVKDYELASLFGKLKYQEDLIDSIYETEKSKSLVSATPLSTAFFSSSIVQDFQDSPNDEEDTRSSYEYLNDLEEEYQARALLAKSKGSSKRVLKSLAMKKQLTKLNATNVAKSVILQETDFEAKYHKVKAKLALLSSSASAPSSSSGKNKGLIAETYDWDDEEVSSDENEVTKVKALMALTDEEKVLVGKESARNGDWTKISMKKVHTLLRIEDNDDRKSFLDYLFDESSVCSTPLPPLKKLDGAEPISGPKTFKSILKSKSSFKAETLKGIIINEPSSAPDGGKSSSASKTYSAPVGKLKIVKMEDDPPLAIVMKELNELKLQISKKKSSYSRNKNAQQAMKFISAFSQDLPFKAEKKLPLIPWPTPTSYSSESVKVHVNSITVNHVYEKNAFL
ncbi:hypothetical protein Tco_0926973 [Tanacetum coccineum]|uniref:Retrovirus-related Pol polyprotein from transposon TNT 1-94 n=1 Tax=Tanacetum coccineum TaxID=301880 RepID=A0ABQ5DHJ6_9ASTR